MCKLKSKEELIRQVDHLSFYKDSLKPKVNKILWTMGCFVALIFSALIICHYVGEIEDIEPSLIPAILGVAALIPLKLIIKMKTSWNAKIHWLKTKEEHLPFNKCGYGVMRSSDSGLQGIMEPILVAETVESRRVVLHYEKSSFSGRAGRCLLFDDKDLTFDEKVIKESDAPCFVEKWSIDNTDRLFFMLADAATLEERIISTVELLKRPIGATENTHPL